MKSIARELYVSSLLKLPTQAALRLDYFRRHRHLADLRRPELFSEKLLWRQLYDTRPELTLATGKLWGKSRARGTPSLSVAPTHWAGPVTEIRNSSYLSALPKHERWVLKQNNLGGGLVYFGQGNRPPNEEIEQFLIRCEATSRKFERLAGVAWSTSNGEFFVEGFIGDVPPTDYKFHVFHGRAEVVSVYRDRFEGLTVSHYDRNGKPLPISSRRSAHDLPQMPHVVARMLPIAEAIAHDFDYLRVDLFDVSGTIYFGELAPYPALDGLGNSRAVDRWLGKLW